MITVSDLEILNQMINDNAKISLITEEGSNRSKVILTDPQASNSKVTIYGLSTDAVVINVDKFKSPDTILAGTKNECKRADYIIVNEKNGKKNILHVELKTTKAPEHEIIDQLKGSICFVGYCREIAKVFWDHKNFLSDFQPRFVSFGHTGSINKKPTREERKGRKNDTPERMMKVHYPHKPQFNQLVGA